MKFEKIINLLESMNNQSFKVRTKNWDEVNDDARRTFCDYSVAYILVNRTIGITAAGSKKFRQKK